MQGPVLIYIVMPVVILLALFILVAVPFAGTRGSGHSLSGGRHSHGPESQDQIPGHSVAPDSFGGDAINLGHAQHMVTAHVHVPRADAVLSEAPPTRRTPVRSPISQLAERAACHERVTCLPGNRSAGPRPGAHLFAQTMGYVAATAALFALGAYLGRNLPGGAGVIAFIAAFACLIGMQFAARKSRQLTVGLLGAFGLLTGLALAPVLTAYAGMDPQALWQAGGATALFIAGFGAAGYATRRDLTAIARAGLWALLALIGFGIALIFVNIPGGALIYSVLGLVIFAGFTMFDFQRIRRSQDIRTAPLLAASIFLDILNVFLFFLQIFSGEER